MVNLTPTSYITSTLMRVKGLTLIGHILVLKILSVAKSASYYHVAEVSI